jgi:hypothetical protein
MSAESVDCSIGTLQKSLHPNHYLIVLAKRHLVSLLAKNLAEKSVQELRQLKTICKEVFYHFFKIPNLLSFHSGSCILFSKEMQSPGLCDIYLC